MAPAGEETGEGRQRAFAVVEIRWQQPPIVVMRTDSLTRAEREARDRRAEFSRRNGTGAYGYGWYVMTARDAARTIAEGDIPEDVLAREVVQ